MHTICKSCKFYYEPACFICGLALYPPLDKDECDDYEERERVI